MAQAEKKAPDWERIEADYRAGILSVREIAAAQGVSHVAIAKRAKRDGWERDLAAKIKSKADALVTKRTVTSLVTTERTVTERQIVEAGAEAIANVRMAHRGDIRRSRDLAMSMLSELGHITDAPQLYEQLADILGRSDGDGGPADADILASICRKVVALPGRIDSMKKLSDTLKTLIGLEREAYGINASQSDGGSQVKSGLGYLYGEDD